MKGKTINFFSITCDKNTGYGKASSNMIDTLVKAGNKVNTILPGRPGPVADIDFFIRPPPWGGGRSKRKIAYFYWEATPFPAPWASMINSVDEIWAPCQLVADCCKLAGFKGKLSIIPTPMIPVDFSTVPDLKVAGIRDDSFIFYSIFQWHNRKGWKELLLAYFDEFNADDNVSLIIKTNPINHLLQNQTAEDIRALKAQFGNKKTAPLVVFPSIISEQELLSIHKAGHCYVTPHHGEGWGMPTHEAILAGKQIIATKFGGVVQYLDDECFHPIPFSMVPVTGMEWNCAYDTYQNWAQPDIGALKGIMRDVATNYKSYIWKNILINKNIDKLSLGSIVQSVKVLL